MEGSSALLGSGASRAAGKRLYGSFRARHDWVGQSDLKQCDAHRADHAVRASRRTLRPENRYVLREPRLGAAINLFSKNGFLFDRRGTPSS